MRWLLRLYPAGWRERYGEEVKALLESERPSLRLGVDLLAGAVDARMNRHWRPTSKTEASEMTSLVSNCRRSKFSARDQKRSAAWMISSSLGLVALYFAITALVGDHVATDALLYSIFSMALILSWQPTVMKDYPKTVRRLLTGAGVVGSYVFFLAVTAIAN